MLHKRKIMSLIQLSIVPIEDLIDELISFIDDVYNTPNSAIEIENTIADITEGMDEGLWVLIEYPYVDKVYRDSYYSYFSSKHNAYSRDCIRLSFFSEKISLEYFRQPAFEPTLKESFRGYLVIRPTFPNIIGRSLLDKRIFTENNFVICNYKGNVSVNGVKLDVCGFPHSSQDGESLSCAETTIWSIMEYFGNRYPDYRPAFPSNILNVLSKFVKQRLLPSNGLTVDQISFALKEFGFGTYIYSRKDAYNEEIENIISYYIESGIPIIAALENDNVAHAIVVIGHEIDSTLDFKSIKKRKLRYGTKKVEYIDYTDLPRKYVVNDDNLPPYTLVDLGYPVERYGDNSEFTGCIIESIVVPLYKKIYLEAVKAKGLVLAVASDEIFGYKFKKDFVFRFFLTSSRSLKQHIVNQDSLSIVLKDYLILSKMPKFIWCGEFYEKNKFNSDQVSGLIIIDATEANEIWMDSLIFASYPDRTYVKIDGEYALLPIKLELYNRFKNNLD